MDAFLKTCVNTLPPDVLTLIYNRWLNTHGFQRYLTEDTRCLKITSKHAFIPPFFSPRNLTYNMEIKYIFTNDGCLYAYYRTDDILHPVKIDVHTRWVSLYIKSTGITMIWNSLSFTDFTNDEIIRTALATTIVMLHKVFPNKLTKNTVIHDIYCGYCEKQNYKPISVNDIFTIPVEKWKKKLFKCCLM